jgi:hypothetical protein
MAARVHDMSKFVESWDTASTATVSLFFAVVNILFRIYWNWAAGYFTMLETARAAIKKEMVRYTPTYLVLSNEQFCSVQPSTHHHRYYNHSVVKMASFNRRSS